jgi:hypothetical protein
VGEERNIFRNQELRVARHSLIPAVFFSVDAGGGESTMMMEYE